MADLQVSSNNERQLIDITDAISKTIPVTGDGVVHIFVRHTTCAVTTIDSDPDIDLDLFDFLASITPAVQWRHPHNPAHTPAHLLSSIIGPDVSIPFTDGRLRLGTWQRIILVELDGPRERSLTISVLKSS